MIRKPMILVLFALLLVPGMAFAAASVCTVDAPQSNGAGLWSQKVTWTASGSDGNFTQCNLSYAIDGLFAYVETDPGSPAPTAAYDLTFTDDMGLTYTVSDRSDTATEQTKPSLSGTAGVYPVWGRLRLDIANNSQAAATGTIRLFWFGKE